MPRHRRAALLATSTMVAATAVAGSLASDPHGSYYASLRKPSWTPPGSVFPVVWSGLYATIAATTGPTLAELREADTKTQDWEAAGYLCATTVNLALNAGWTWIFFRARNPGLSAAWAAALTISSVGLAQRTFQVKMARGVVLAPYAGWTAFATALSTAIWRMNR
ncbi:TspO/MBR family protein [Actinomyces wuliandei]|uniref:TspO/MBR family protein n=1 Tax=Actinomyces wuliandei TaxID=2057743 RepID=UPI000FDB61A1|nr:TspO/MBR family protein [Actinomyces wuliandei]